MSAQSIADLFRVYEIKRPKSYLWQGMNQKDLIRIHSWSNDHVKRVSTLYSIPVNINLEDYELRAVSYPIFFEKLSLAAVICKYGDFEGARKVEVFVFQSDGLEVCQDQIDRLIAAGIPLKYDPFNYQLGSKAWGLLKALQEANERAT
jgi:hypothetical protein